MSQQLTLEQAAELYDFLEGPEGCDFQQSNPEDINTATWKCDHTLTKTHRWLQEHGLSQDVIDWHACCDCEVVFNFPQGLMPE